MIKDETVSKEQLIPNNRWITLVQIVGCILVVFGHSFPFITPIPLILRNIRKFIYVFHMPLFIWCSGYLFSYTQQETKYAFLPYVLRRAKRLLIPYVFFSLIGIIPKWLFSPYLNDRLALDFYSILRTFLVPRENIWGHFWFLPMIFWMGMIGYGWSVVLNRISTSSLKEQGGYC